MHCCFCNKHVESIDEAVELGWYPDFWKGDVNYQGPICEELPESLPRHRRERRIPAEAGLPSAATGNANERHQAVAACPMAGERPHWAEVPPGQDCGHARRPTRH